MPDFAVRTIIGAVDKFSTILGHMGVNMGKFGEKAHGAFALAERGASIFKSVLGANLVSGAIQRIGHAIEDLPNLVTDFAERGEQIGRTAQMLGITADAYQRLAYAAKLTDTPTEAFDMSMRKLNLAIGQGERGMGPLIKQMYRLNAPLAAQLRTVRNADEAFMDVADAVSKTTDVQRRAAIVTAAFGKAGQQMLPMLLKGREGLMELRKAALDVIPDDALHAADRFNVGMKILKANVQSVKDQVLGFVVKAVTPYLEKAIIWLQANREIIATKIENFITRFANSLRDAKPYLLFLWNAASWLIKNWPLLIVVYGAWTAAQLALDAAMLASGIPEIVIGITAMIAAVIMVIKYWKEITGALQAAWNWFDRLYNKSLILRNAIFFLASPIWLVVEAIRTLVDLLSGRGLKSFENFIPPWLKGATDKLGITQQGANQGSWASGEAPNKGQGAMSFVNQVNVDNSRAPGTNSSVRTSQRASGNPGMQYAMGGTP